MGEAITKSSVLISDSVNQGDILNDIEYIEYIKDEDNIIEIANIVFPKVIVLSQSCDLDQDARAREKNKSTPKGENIDQDKYLISVIVAPLYNFEDFRAGLHLSQLDLKMQIMTSKKCNSIKNNEDKRYHYLHFDDEVKITDSIIDFKHYFTCNINYLNVNRKSNYLCSVDPLYRELISQRFSNFLSRIGLPDPE